MSGPPAPLGRTVVSSQTWLAQPCTLLASLRAPWTPTARAAARAILSRIAATEEARRSREVRARLPAPVPGLIEEARAAFAAVPALGEEADPQGFIALHCARAQAADLADWLLDHGAERVSVIAVEQVFDKRNALHDALIARIGER